jgi:hypothetical protein
MKKLIVSLAVLGFTFTSAHAQLSSVGDGFVILDVSGSGNTFYGLDFALNEFDTDNSSATALSRTFTINLGDTILMGGENQTFDKGVGTSSSLRWRVSTDFTTGSFSDLSLPYLESSDTHDKWRLDGINDGAPMVDIVDGLGPGTYYLEIVQFASRDTTDVYKNEADQAGNNWEAQINIIPEPSTMIMVVFGLASAVMVLRRRR